jgi:hypothetical protein
VTKHLPRKHKALGLISRTTKKLFNPYKYITYYFNNFVVMEMEAKIDYITCPISHR